ncbi:MAG: hypothetical protein LIO93_02950 [Bacteroidales bacterium]|nr:hypothetical protein [Bacteroidales bacterium]
MKSKIIYLLTTVLVSSLLFNAYEDDAKGPVYNELGNKDYVSFLSATQTFEIDQNSKVLVYMGHANKNIVNTNAKVVLSFDDEESEALFSLASDEISFGTNPLVPVEIIYDIDKLEFKKNYAMTLKIADDETTYPLGSDIKETTVTIKRALTFSYVGKGLYTSLLLEGDTEEVDIERADQNPNVYRLSGFYKNAIEFIIDPKNGTAIIDPQDLGEDIFGEGTNSWIWCESGTYSDGVCTFGGNTWDNAWFTDDALEAGAPMENEVIVLPPDSY